MKSTLESIIADQMAKFEHQIRFSIDSLKTRTKQTDQLLNSTIEKLNKKPIADRPDSTKAGKGNAMPSTLNLPDLPLTRV